MPEGASSGPEVANGWPRAGSQPAEGWPRGVIRGAKCGCFKGKLFISGVVKTEGKAYISDRKLKLVIK